jgi:hypothetical protein
VGGAGTEPAAGGGRQNEGADIESGEDGGDDGAGQHDVHRRRGRLDRIWRGRRRHGSAGIAVLQCVGGRLEGGRFLRRSSAGRLRRCCFAEGSLRIAGPTYTVRAGVVAPWAVGVGAHDIACRSGLSLALQAVQLEAHCWATPSRRLIWQRHCSKQFL